MTKGQSFVWDTQEGLQQKSKKLFPKLNEHTTKETQQGLAARD